MLIAGYICFAIAALTIIFVLFGPKIPPSTKEIARRNRRLNRNIPSTPNPDLQRKNRDKDTDRYI